MTDEAKPQPGYMTEDVHPVLIGGPPRYARITDEPVQYLAVKNDEDLLGYLWFCDSDDAARFVRRTRASVRTGNAAVAWNGQLLHAKGQGLPPSAAVHKLISSGGNPRIGWVGPFDEAKTSTLPELRELAD